MKRIAFLLLIVLLLLAGCNQPGAESLETGTPVTPTNKPEPGTETWRFTGSLPYQEMWKSEKESINYIRGNTEYGEPSLREAITIGNTCYYGHLAPAYNVDLENAEFIGTLTSEPCESFTTPLRHLQTTFNKEEGVKLFRGEAMEGHDYLGKNGMQAFYVVSPYGSVQQFTCDTSYPPYYDDGRWIIWPLTLSYAGLSPAERTALFHMYVSHEFLTGPGVHLNSFALRSGNTCYYGYPNSFGIIIHPEDIPKGAKRLGQLSGICTGFTTPTEELQINYDLHLEEDAQLPVAFYSETFLRADDIEMPWRTIYLVYDNDRVQYFFVETTETPVYYDENRWMAAPAWLPR